MDTLGERLKYLRKSKNLNQEDLISIINSQYNTSIVRSMLSKWENNKEYPRMDFISKLCEFFNVSVDYLTCNSHYKNSLDELSNNPDLQSTLQSMGCIPNSNFVKIPILGEIKAGYNHCANELLIGYEYVEKDYLAGKSDCFFLRITGDSMTPMFQENDLVLIEPTTCIESGTISAVLINNDEATLKRVIHNENSLILQPFNALYEPKVFINEEMNNIKILGKVIRSIRNF